jgi:hypothetical protein
MKHVWVFRKTVGNVFGFSVCWGNYGKHVGTVEETVEKASGVLKNFRNSSGYVEKSLKQLWAC